LFEDGQSREAVTGSVKDRRCHISPIIQDKAECL
jgi:hypothetical protein